MCAREAWGLGGEVFRGRVFWEFELDASIGSKRVQHTVFINTSCRTINSPSMSPLADTVTKALMQSHFLVGQHKITRSYHVLK